MANPSDPAEVLNLVQISKRFERRVVTNPGLRPNGRLIPCETGPAIQHALPLFKRTANYALCGFCPRSTLQSA
ncbi:MAG: hypothetical protein C0517_06630 [Erythrobacter sp.]|nr:hypothetical protein [Erythrobacter sp.]